jgi:hypothetical protein
MELNLKFKDDQSGTSINKINLILLHLSEGKFKDTFTLIQDIQLQANEQMSTKKNVELEEVEDVIIPMK